MRAADARAGSGAKLPDSWEAPVIDPARLFEWRYAASLSHGVYDEKIVPGQ
jgi:hypothetical protein